MMDSREQPEDAPPRVSEKKKRGRDGAVIDNGVRIREREGKVVRARRGRVNPVRGTEGERERRTEKDDRRKEVGLALVCRLLSGNTYSDRRREGGGGGRKAKRKRKKDARRSRERGCRNKRKANR